MEFERYAIECDAIVQLIDFDRQRVVSFEPVEDDPRNLRNVVIFVVDGMRSLAQRPEASGTLRSNHCRSGRDLMAASSFIRTRIIGKTGRRTLFRLAHRATVGDRDRTR